MEGRFLDNLPAIKDAVRRYAQKALEYGFIGQKKHDAVCKRIDEDSVTIGVIGQMKSGKSTFLNAFLFADNILPVSVTPMTAALTEITWGAKKAVQAEFYTKDEWAGVAALAKQNGEDAKTVAARELVEKSKRIGGQLESLLGTVKSAAFEDLEQFVGAEGKYTALTKSAKIVYPLDILRGARIVDTPGFNDPVVSREERSAEFLSKADVVILLLYVGRACDAIDLKIIEKVRNVGVGKIVIAITKFDVQVEERKLDEDIPQYVIDQIHHYVRGDEAAKRLFKDPNPILVSAQMALLARIPFAEIEKDEDLSFYYKHFCQKFGVSSQKELLASSRIHDLESEIDNLLKKEKVEILVNKSLNEIQGAIAQKKTELEKEILSQTELVQNLSLSPEELEEKIKDAERQERRIKKLADSTEEEIKDFVSERIPEAARRMENDQQECRKRLHDIVDKVKTETEFNKRAKLEIEDLQYRLKDEFAAVYSAIKTEFKTQNENIRADIEDIVSRYDEDGNADEYLKGCKEVLRRFDDMSMEDVFLGDKEFSAEFNAGHFFGGFFSVLTLGIGLAGKWSERWGWNAKRDDAHKWVDNEAVPSIPAEDYRRAFAPIGDRAAEFTAAVRKAFLDDFATRIREQVEECRQKMADREKNLREAREKLEKAQSAKKTLEAQAAEAYAVIDALGL
ncbi:MAG: hypothetical protein Pg6C_17720 [Treponemataceae bacterium]|nr:MAG: hypothetical protein Pg6C_17720 [Treponemataceae bacterium]